MGYDRPSVAFEYEISLALIDTNQNLTFDEDPHAPIVGSFEVILVARDIKLIPPNSGLRPLRNGYDPAAQQIPDVSKVGVLGFNVWDRPTTDRMAIYNGQPCVARIVTSIDYKPVRTVYCSYFKPTMTIDSKSGDEAGDNSVEGDFSVFGSA